MVIFLRCLNISLLGPSDLAFLDLGNDFSLNWTLQISPQLSALRYLQLPPVGVPLPGKLLF